MNEKDKHDKKEFSNIKKQWLNGVKTPLALAFFESVH